MATDRDLQVLRWIAHQYAAQFSQIRQLLTRYADAELLQDNLISEAVTKDQINRWQRAGWCEYQRFLAQGRGWCWPTRKGLHMLGLEAYHAQPPATVRLNHLFAVNQVRLGLEQYEWVSERQIRAGLLLKKGGESTPIPDGYIRTEKGRIAVEVELSQKKPAELVKKLRTLIGYLPFDEEIGNYRPFYPTIWFFVPDKKIQRAVEAARDSLHKDQHQHIHIVLHPSLLLP